MTISVESLKIQLEAINDIQEEVVLSSINNLNNVQDWNLAASSCKDLADALRSASLRSPLGEAGLIQVLATLLSQTSNIDFQIQALRVLGNLCFDHENNRNLVNQAAIVPIVTPYLTSSHDVLVRTVCGFLLNSSMNCSPILNEIASTGAADHLIDLINPDKEDDGSITMALKVLDNVVAEDDARKIMSTPKTVKQLVIMLDHLYKSEEYIDDLDNLENILDVLLQIIMDDDALQNEIIDMGALDWLLDFLENSDVEMEDKEEKDKLEEIRKTLNKVIVFAASTDTKMNELYDDQQVLSRLLTMAKSKSEVVHQCAVYILGNLARSDEHCVELVEKYHLSGTLLDLYQTTENATFQYAILGCLKHLCLPISNKTVIGNEDCIRILSPTLDNSKDMLKRNQFLTIGIIKLLCAGNYENAKRVVNESLALVMDFLKRVDDVAAKSEATRVLTNLIKTIWVQPDSIDLKNKVMDSNVVAPIVELVRSSTFPILKNDGIMALTLIFSKDESSSVLNKALPLTVAEPETQDISEDGNEKADKRSFVQVVVDDICNSEIPVQIKCNACVLLVKVVECARLVEDQAYIVDTIRTLASDRLATVDSNTELYKYSNTLLMTLQQ